MSTEYDHDGQLSSGAHIIGKLEVHYEVLYTRTELEWYGELTMYLSDQREIFFVSDFYIRGFIIVGLSRYEQECCNGFSSSRKSDFLPAEIFDIILGF